MKQLGMGDVDGNSILLTDTTSIDEARRVA